MGKHRHRRRDVAAPTPFELARDELMQQIIRCGVLDATPEHQGEWFDDTMRYLAERYPELSEEQLSEVRTLGQRFCEPPKSNIEETSAVSAA